MKTGHLSLAAPEDGGPLTGLFAHAARAVEEPPAATRSPFLSCEDLHWLALALRIGAMAPCRWRGVRLGAQRRREERSAATVLPNVAWS